MFTTEENINLIRPDFLIGNYSRSLINKMLHIGLPAGSQFIFEAGAFGLSAIMMGWLGTTALAAHQIAINLATISYMTTSGLGAAATIRVGNFWGQRDQKNITSICFYYDLDGDCNYDWPGRCCLFLVDTFYPLYILKMQAVIELTASLMIIAAFFQLSDGIQVVTAGALRGLQDVKIPSMLIFVAYWILALPLGYCACFSIEHEGEWNLDWTCLPGLTLTASCNGGSI